MPPGLCSFAVTCCMQSTFYTSWCHASLSIMQAVQCSPCSMCSCTVPALAPVDLHAFPFVSSACLPSCSVQVNVSPTPCTHEATFLDPNAADWNADGHPHTDLPETSPRTHSMHRPTCDVQGQALLNGRLLVCSPSLLTNAFKSLHCKETSTQSWLYTNMLFTLNFCCACTRCAVAMQG